MNLEAAPKIVLIAMALTVSTPHFMGNALGADGLPYPVVGTGQRQCYSDSGMIPPPKLGEPFYGQDAQYPKLEARYQDNGDGTVSDLNTGLMWVQARGEKLPWDDAVADATKCHTGGHKDWRTPTIKELYSLIDFNGGFHPEGDSVPYIAKDFEFKYGDTSKGERAIDCQDWSATPYVGAPLNGSHLVFGVNFADGRIKGYPTADPRRGGPKKLFVRYVRGNPSYGKNDFFDNGDGTVADNATGLTWQKADSGRGLNWEDALAWVQKQNAEKHLGHDDWRLPNAKELQSIVDYTRAPQSTYSFRRGPAINPVFQISRLPDGEFPYFWTSTTHLDGPQDMQGHAAVYVAFGRATGWMGPPPRGGKQGSSPRSGSKRRRGPDGQGGPDGMNDPGGPGGPDGPGSRRPPGPDGQGSGADGNYRLLDVHGAGAQRSDPKSGDPSAFPHGRGPQGDVIRIFNYVRCVRGGLNQSQGERQAGN